MANISFDANYYYEQKLNQLQSTDSEQYGDWTIADVALSFNENGLTPEEHYEKYGAAEGLNPSAEFDTQAYLSAKLGLLQEQDSEQYADWTVADVAQSFEDNGLSPLEHFNQYGQDEGLEATPAAASALTEALETLQDAEQAKEDFLASAASNDAVEAEIADSADDPENPTATDIEDAIAAVDTAASDALQTDRADGSDRVIEAELADAQEAVSNYEAEIAKVEGLEQAIAAKSAAAAQVEAATEAQTEANADLSGAVVTFDELNGNTDEATIITYLDADGNSTTTFSDVASVTDGTDELFTVSNGELTATAADDTEGVAALQAEVQSKLDAEIDLEEANAAESSADTELAAIDDLSDADFADSVTDGSAVYEELVDLEGSVETAQNAVDERAELVADAEEAGALADQLDAATQSITDAETNLTDDEADGGFGVNLVDLGETGTSEDDLFVFSAGDDTSTDQFGAAGEDQIYVGDSFTRVDLAADADFTEEQGDVSTIEAFFQQDGSNAVLTFEDKAFAGNGSSAEDLTEVTLTGVNAEDLSLDNGYVSVA